MTRRSRFVSGECPQSIRWLRTMVHRASCVWSYIDGLISPSVWAHRLLRVIRPSVSLQLTRSWELNVYMTCRWQPWWCHVLTCRFKEFKSSKFGSHGPMARYVLLVTSNYDKLHRPGVSQGFRELRECLSPGLLPCGGCTGEVGLDSCGLVVSLVTSDYQTRQAGMVGVNPGDLVDFMVHSCNRGACVP